MSDETVEVVRRCFEVFEQRDAQGARDLLDPEVEWDTTRFPFPDLSGVYRAETMSSAGGGAGSEHGRP